MRSEFNRFFIYGFMAIFLSACGAATVSVDNPVDGNVYTEIPAIELSFTKGIPDPFEVSVINSTIMVWIKSLFEKDEKRITANPAM